METEFIFWRHDTPAGIRVEEISGGEDKSDKLWKIMAHQVFGENGGNRYREIGHFDGGAPYLDDEPQRISISHTRHFMVIAFLPRTPEAGLDEFNLRTAMGIDTERIDRGQVLRIADRFLSPEESELVARYADSLTAGSDHHPAMEAGQAAVCANILAWTVKEALFKAALTEGLDFREKLRIITLPEICNTPMVKDPGYGKAEIILPDSAPIAMELFSYISEGHIVTLAYSPKCAKFRKS